MRRMLLLALLVVALSGCAEKKSVTIPPIETPVSPQFVEDANGWACLTPAERLAYWKMVKTYENDIATLIAILHSQGVADAPKKTD